MEVIKTNIPDVLVIRPQIFTDKRGCFFESYNKKLLASKGFNVDFLQDNQSISHKGVIRGLHFQAPPLLKENWYALYRVELSTLPLILEKIHLSTENMLWLLYPQKIMTCFGYPKVLLMDLPHWKIIRFFYIKQPITTIKILKTLYCGMTKI